MLAKLLVISQFSLIVLIAIVGNSSVFSHPLSLLMILLAIIIGLTPIIQKQFKVNVFPEVTKDMILITSGIYKYIRHPMYLSVIMLGLSFVIADPKPIMFLVWAILIFNLHLKMDIEETNLLIAFPEYKDYKRNTKRLIPYIY